MLTLSLEKHRINCFYCLERRRSEPTFHLLIHVDAFSGKFTYMIARDSRVIELVKRILADLKISVERWKLKYKESNVSYLRDLSDYISSMENEPEFRLILRMCHWTQTAAEYPEIYQLAIAQVGLEKNELERRFNDLFKETLQKAMVE
jgi:hypothetical protein